MLSFVLIVVSIVRSSIHIFVKAADYVMTVWAEKEISAMVVISAKIVR